MALPIPETPRSSLMPFVVAERWLWVQCDTPGYEGFHAEVRLNLTNAERRILQLLMEDVDAKRRDIAERSTIKLSDLFDDHEAAEGEAKIALAGQIADVVEAAKAEHEANTARIRLAVTPFIRAWNIGTPDETGAIVDAPPPRDAGVDAFEAIDSVMEGWLVGAILAAYREGKGWSSSLTMHGESGPRGNGHSSGGKPGKTRRSRPSVVS